MTGRARSLALGLPWLAALVLASCTTGHPQGGQEAARDAFYAALSTEEAAMARQAVQEALETRPSDATYRWAYGNGSTGSVTPVRTFRIKTGHYCRDYAETIAKGPQPASTVRTACRSDQGTWRVVKR